MALSSKHLLNMHSQFISGCSCIDKCTKNGNKIQYCNALCGDHSKYLDCLSRCQTTGGNIDKCISNHECINDCNTNCKAYWPGTHELH